METATILPLLQTFDPIVTGAQAGPRKSRVPRESLTPRKGHTKARDDLSSTDYTQVDGYEPSLQAGTACSRSLKASIRAVLSHAPSGGMTNAQIGRSLGIYAGHAGHVGHISRTLLEMLKSEGVVAQDSITKRWRLVPMLDDIDESD